MIPEKPLKEMLGSVKGVTTEPAGRKGSILILVDSGGWIEYFGEGTLADKYAAIIENANKEEIVTPTIVIYEYTRKSNL